MSTENRAAVALREIADLVEKGVLDIQAVETSHSDAFNHNGHPILSTCKVTIRHELKKEVDPATHLDILRLFAALLYVPYEEAHKRQGLVEFSKTGNTTTLNTGGTA